MRIVMMTNTYLPHVGGVANSVRLFAEAYRRRGHAVLIVCPEFPDQPANERDVFRIPALQNFNGSDFSVALPPPPELRDVLADFKPEIIHSHHPFLLGGTALRIAAEWSIPVVFTHHTMYEQYTHYVPADSPQLQRFVIDLATGYSNLCNAVIAPSHSIERILLERKVEAPISVIPTGVDQRRFTRGDGRYFRQKAGIPQRAYVVGHVGRLAPEKNLAFLSEAVAEFLTHHRDAYFLVAGDGPALPEVAQIMHRHGVDRRVRLVGARRGAELVSAYHAMNAFAFASCSETQGMVLMEALSCGVPVVALDAPGARDVMVHECNGILLPSAHVADFAEALHTLAVESPENRERRSARIVEDADQFSIDHGAGEALSLYQTLCAAPTVLKDAQDSLWWTALRRIEVEFEIWSNVAGSLADAVVTKPLERVHWIRRVASSLRRTRRWLSRSELSIRLFNLPASHGTATQPGLIMVQIDGLARRQFESALTQRHLPFLRRLISIDDYRLLSFYSGVPSTTPAVQGELFYGQRCCVPAFSFFDRERNEAVRMYYAAPAQRIEQSLRDQASGLLEEGSSYSNIYTGGAAWPHFCAALSGWNRFFGTAGPIRVALVMLSYFWSGVRIAALAVVELVLALIELFRGLLDGQDFWMELKFIPSRLMISIALREVITIGACIDASRGLPIIHLNFLGYDEQSHRRGPSSAFAHWALKGIDGAIRRIYRSALKSPRRDYTMVVYSDHGQQQVQSYIELYGKTVEDTVQEIFKLPLSRRESRTERERGIQGGRAALIGGKRFQERVTPRRKEDDTSTQPEEIVVSAMGPVGHIYLPKTLLTRDLSPYCKALVEHGNIPLVILPTSSSTAHAWTKGGEFAFPAEIEKVLGTRHEFLDELRHDLIDFCAHPNSGDIIICGWRSDGPPISFPIERGAHGGFGDEETRGFVLLPPHAPFADPESGYLRPLELRELAMEALGRSHARGIRHLPTKARKPDVLRIMTYNVHTCIGGDGKLSIDRIARVIAYYDPDIIALQELDVRRLRTGHSDQVEAIARLVRMESHFHPAYEIEGEKYGDAILSRFPMRLMKAGALPTIERARSARPLEPRGALLVEVEVQGKKIRVLNTHLGLRRRERNRQVNTLLSADWLHPKERSEPSIVLGDFNALPRSHVCEELCASFIDVQQASSGRPLRTWPGRLPISRIDHIFVSSEFRVEQVLVPRTSLTIVASDHLPLIADLEFKQNGTS